VYAFKTVETVTLQDQTARLIDCNTGL
jgi:hypothetical protein